MILDLHTMLNKGAEDAGNGGFVSRRLDLIACLCLLSCCWEVCAANVSKRKICCNHTINTGGNNVYCQLFCLSLCASVISFESRIDTIWIPWSDLKAGLPSPNLSNQKSVVHLTSPRSTSSKQTLVPSNCHP